MAVILIGAESEVGGTALGPAAEKGYLTKRTAAKTGKVETLKLKVPSSNKNEKWRLGIFTAVASKPGTLIEETATITIAKETATVVEGALTGKPEITEGTEYFLALLPTAIGKVGKFTEKAGWGFKSTLGITELGKGIYTTAEDKYGEPGPIWGEGTEGGAEVKEIAGTAKVKLASVDALSPSMLLTPTTKAQFKQADAVAQAQGVASTSKVRFQDVLALSTGNQIAIVGTTQLRFKTANAPSQAQTLVPTTKARFKAAEETLLAMALAATTKARFKTADAQSTTMRLQGTSQVRFKDSAELTVPSAIAIAGVSTLRFRTTLSMGEEAFAKHPGRVAPHSLTGTTSPVS